MFKNCLKDSSFNFLYKNISGTPSDLLDGLIKDVNKFTGDAEQIDDISILVLSRN